MFLEFKQILRIYQNSPGTKCVWLGSGGDIFDDISTKDKIKLKMVFISGKIRAVKKNQGGGE